MFWPGGLYGTTGFAGSRSGMTIASSWISMMRLGEEGYQKNASIVQQGILFYNFSNNQISKLIEKLGIQSVRRAKNLLYWI
jgi:glutamate/tyrosine decarboxylase-like PLP-dependent enzyme